MNTNSPRIEPLCKSWMNLQLFAEPAEVDVPDQPTTETQEEAQQRMYPLEEVMKMIQSETDKRVTQALKKQEKDFKKQMSLSGLDEQQRAIAERDSRIAEQDEQIRILMIAQNKAELTKTLAARGLPVEFADVIEVGDDAEAAQKKVDALDAAFKRAIENAVNQRLAGGSLPGRGTMKGATMTKDQIMAIKDPNERQKAIKENIDLFMR